MLYGGDVFAISHKEILTWGRLYIFVLGGIIILFNVDYVEIIFAYSHLLAYCVVIWSVNPLLLITHCQDENRQLIIFWNEYS